MSERCGTIELICGCMFSGKSERLLARLAAAEQEGARVAVFKHASDDRYSHSEIVTHSGRRAGALPVRSSAVLREMAGDAEVILIDEAQFFDAALPGTCVQLAQMGRDVVIAGLDRDSWGQPFGSIPELRRIATRVTTMRARCSCGAEAEYTQRLVPVEGVKMIGGAEAYEPRCGRCFQPPPMSLRC